MSKQILFAHDQISLEEIGGKAASLHELQDLNVPSWFVISQRAFDQSQCDLSTPSSWTISAHLEVELNESLDSHFSEGDFFAVRSSAVDEDSKDFSFAGQLDSYLGVPKDQIAEKIVAVWQSAFSERIKTYRLEHNLGECIPPAVIVQKMVNSSSAGVSFAVDPISGYWGRALVSSVWGLGSALVDGEVDADTWQIDRSDQITHSQIGHKQIGRYLENGREVELSHDEIKGKKASLSDKQVAEVARLARRCSQVRGVPQDIEWAFEDKQLYLLQSRPITSLGKVPDPEGNINIWDNSNIAESYGGVTTPLTYSFARGIYAEVYRQFCKIMGVSKHVIDMNGETYQGLLGLMNGRMYYNLINWYRLLACFPGFSINREFMEQMMGIQKEMGSELLKLIPTRQDNKVKSVLFLSKALLSMGYNHLFIRKQIKKFYKRLNRALAQPEIPLVEQRPDELAKSYRDLEEQLLLKWDAPLVNDFFAMIFFGILSKLCKAWFDDENGTLQNDLVGGSGKVISAEPAKKVKEMAALLTNDKELITLFREGSVQAIITRIRSHPELNQKYSAYLEKFGDRCIDELKLESITLHDNPLPLLRAVGHFAGRKEMGNENSAKQARTNAEDKVRVLLHKNRLKSFVFNYILKHARGRVEDRENLRFERTRLFGRVRQIMVEIGRRFSALNVLDEYQDIFYLEKDEILSFISGFASCPDIRGIANVRKRHFSEYNKMEPIADRFETRGMVFVANDFSRQDTDHEQELNEGYRQGIGCCPGIVRGKVRVVRDPRGVELPAGCILVAERTDPGWIMLFPAAAGLLVEKGSLLSHSAIVARELGLPAVVSIPSVTTWLNDGDEVEFNGSTGIVTLLKKDHE